VHLGAAGPGELAGPGEARGGERLATRLVVEQGRQVAPDLLRIRAGVGDRLAADLGQRQPGAW
jgi:hypothetical protein